MGGNEFSVREWCRWRTWAGHRPAPPGHPITHPANFGIYFL